MDTTRWKTCLFLASLNFAEVVGKTTSYEFGDDCTVSWKTLDEGDQIYVGYNGKDVLDYCDDYSFQGQGDELLDEYEVCVTPLNFTDPNCAVRLDFKSSFFGSTLNSITCTDNYNKKYCGPQNEFLYILFEKRNNKATSNARFKLLITANKVLDQGDIVGAVVGGIFGAIVLISLVTGLVCWCVCRRKPTQGQVLHPDQGNQTSGVNQPAYPQAAYSTQPTGNNVTLYPTANYPTANYPTANYPTGNYTTQYSGGNSPQPPFQTQQAGDLPPEEKQPSAPPPSYDSLM